jgi:acyl-CoA reductase-like NAD-dependent aldehyde dehydrogenase
MRNQDRAGKARDLVRALLPDSCRDRGRSWIGGRWVSNSSGKTFDTIDPTTGQTLLPVEIADAHNVAEAVAAASKTSEQWWRKDGQERAATLWRIAAAIRAKRTELATLDTLDAGRPIRDTTARDVERAARIFEFFAGVTDRIRGAAIPVQPGFANRTQLEPYGVVGAIIPWNYPLTNAATKIAPALATGNAIVLKPAEDTPLSALLLAEIADQSGLPAGLLNVVNGPGETTGSEIVKAEGVGKIAFTGSTAVGRLIAADAGRALKSVTLELGGKSPCIVFDDADVETAASAAIFSILQNQGQTCTAGTRLIVDRKVVGRMVDAMTGLARQIRVGDPLDTDTLVGPLVSKRQRERVAGYEVLGQDEGARLNRIAVDWRGDGLDGFFTQPAFFTEVRPEMRISQEEIFGPVLTITPFDTEEEAISLANGTQFGLAGSIWTESLRRAERVSAQVQVGIVWINTVHTLHPGSPYGGYGDSGIGNEMGIEAINQFTKIKSVWTATETWRSPWAVTQ